MSVVAAFMKRRELRVERKLCIGCKRRRARFRYRGVVRSDRVHTLCFQCYRALINSEFADATAIAAHLAAVEFITCKDQG